MIWANKSEDIGTNKLDARVHRFPSRSNFAQLKEPLDHGSGSLFKLKQGCIAPSFIADDNLASHTPRASHLQRKKPSAPANLISVVLMSKSFSQAS